MPEILNDLAGSVFSRLTVLELSGRRAKRTYWRCRCDCGNLTEVARDRLVSGKTGSCGCLWKDTPHSQLRHGKSASAEYRAWTGMKVRCTCETNSRYNFYGARGIRVFEGWANDFEAFFQHVGERPSPKHSLDRIDVNGNYEPGNVRWAVHTTQMRNTTQNRMIEISGETKTMAEWAEFYGIKKATAWRRLSHGMSPIDAFTLPLRA